MENSRYPTIEIPQYLLNEYAKEIKTILLIGLPINNNISQDRSHVLF